MPEEKPVTEVKTEVKAEPEAGEAQPETKPDKDVSTEALELLEASDKALAAAETKIVSLKRKQKQGEDGADEDFDQRVLEVVQRAGLQTKQVDDQDLQELREVRKKHTELVEALKAKRSVSNTSVGSNQMKTEVETDLTKGYSSADLAVLERAATRHKMTLKEYLKTKKP